MITGRPGPRYTRLGTHADEDLDMRACTWCFQQGHVHRRVCVCVRKHPAWPPGPSASICMLS